MLRLLGEDNFFYRRFSPENLASYAEADRIATAMSDAARDQQVGPQPAFWD
jgi:hypothetical protein